MTFSVLIVDDEDGVRRTFHDWLKGLADVQVFAAADAEAALLIANEHPVDLAVLDWNLGSGLDGLRLLEDLVDFQPDIVAVLVTGFANQATPLDALRMGVRDYLDKNHDLNRDTFLTAVRKQLDRLAPLKRQRELNQTLAEFRDAVERILPLVRGSAALTRRRNVSGRIGCRLRKVGRFAHWIGILGRIADMGDNDNHAEPAPRVRRAVLPGLADQAHDRQDPLSPNPTLQVPL